MFNGFGSRLVVVYYRLRAVSLFLENRGEERKTNERASVTVSVICERRGREPLVVWAFSDARATSASRHRCSYVTLTGTLAQLLVLRSSRRIFEKKRDCSQSMFTMHG